MGCGAGCLVVGILVVVLALGGILTTRKMASSMSRASGVVSRVEREFASVDTFTAEPDGRVPADRIRAFLAVREATSGLRSDLTGTVQDLKLLNGPEARSGFRYFRTLWIGANALPKLADYERTRGEALIGQRMGLAEYLYIYSLAYYPGLREEPGNKGRQPPTEAATDLAAEDEWNLDNRQDRVDPRGRRLRLVLAKPLANMVRQAKQADLAANAAWVQTAQQELNKLKSNRNRIPWEDGLPAVIRESFKPFRAELDRSYDPKMNGLEFMQVVARRRPL